VRLVDRVVWGLELVWWLAFGMVALAVVVAVLAVWPLLRRLSGVRRGVLRLHRHAEALERLQGRAAELQERIEQLDSHSAEVRERTDRSQAARQHTGTTTQR
jgi:membrane protein implicated in regulation of membrane protease activity